MFNDVEDLKTRFRNSLRQTTELERLRDPRVQQVIRHNQRICDQRGIPHEFDRAWGKLRR